MGIFIKKNTATGIFHVAVFALRGFCDLLFEKVVVDVCFLFIPPSGTKQAVNVALIAKVIGCIIALALFFGVSFSFCWVSGVCQVRL